MSREGYKPGVISVTELLRHWAQWYPKLWPNNPPAPTGYYLKRGNFVDRCCAIIAQGQQIDERTHKLAWQEREKPLVTKDERKVERWWDYLWPFQEWWADSGLVHVDHQIYVYSEIEGLQGTYDLKAENPLFGKRIRIDFKTGEMPEGCRYQLALYDICEGERCERLGLQLQPGKCTAHPYKDYKDYDTARLMIRFYQRMLEYK